MSVKTGVETQLKEHKQTRQIRSKDPSITGVSVPLKFQVNASPSLTSTTVNDRILKYKLIDNIISIVLPPDGVPE